MNYTIAHTIPEEDLQNYITEDEAALMLKGFNMHLRNFSVQVSELEKQNILFTQKLEKERARNQNTRKLISENKTILNELDEQIDIKSQILSDLENKIHVESSKLQDVFGFNLDAMHSNISSSSLGSRALLSNIEELLGYLTKLESTSIILQTQEDLISKTIIEKHEFLNSEVKCENCKGMYAPSKNYDSACAYHTGKLRYFSCRGCGCDPFYDCCLKCKNCSRGCKVTHHTS